MKIPGVNNFGNQVADAGPAAQFSPAAFGADQDAALEKAGAAGGAVADQLHTQQVYQQDALEKTTALTAYQTHQTNVKVAVQTAGDDLFSGKITPDDYKQHVTDATQQSYDSTLGAIPDSRYKQIASIQNDGLNRTVQLAVGSTLNKYGQQQNALNVGSLLDNAGKDIEVDPNNIAATTANTKAAFMATAPSAGMTPAKANEVYTNWENGAYTQHATTATIQARSNGDLGALTQLQKDLTDPDGFYAGKMSSQQRNQVLSSVVSNKLTLENQLGSAQTARENAAADASNKAADLMNQGHQFSPDYINTLTATVAGTSQEKPVQAMITAAAHNAGFASQPIAAQRTAIQADQQDANTPGVGTDPGTAAAVKQRQQMYSAAVDAYKTNPWQAAQDRGVIQTIPPIDATNLDGLVKSLGARAATVGTIEATAGRPVSLLTPDEADQALKVVNALGPDAKASALQTIGAAYNNAGRIGDLADQWHEKNPAVALSLKAGAAGGNGQPLLTDKGVPVSSYILAGQQALTDKTVKVDDVAGTGIKAQIATAVNGTLPPGQSDDAKEMAYYIALGNAAKNGHQVPDTGDIKGGIDTATGGLATTGGKSVAKPYGWTDDQFAGSVKTATPANIENTIGGKPIDTVYANGKAIPADQFMQKFPSYQLTRVGVRGTYAVVTGSKFVTDKTGAPVTIHLTRGQQPGAQVSPSAAAAPVSASGDANFTPNPF